MIYIGLQKNFPLFSKKIWILEISAIIFCTVNSALVNCKIWALSTLRTNHRNQLQAREILCETDLMRYMIKVTILKLYSLFNWTVTNLTQIFTPYCFYSGKDLQQLSLVFLIHIWLLYQLPCWTTGPQTWLNGGGCLALIIVCIVEIVRVIWVAFWLIIVAVTHVTNLRLSRSGHYQLDLWRTILYVVCGEMGLRRGFYKLIVLQSLSFKVSNSCYYYDCKSNNCP